MLIQQSINHKSSKSTLGYFPKSLNKDKQKKEWLPIRLHFLTQPTHVIGVSLYGIIGCKLPPAFAWFI